MNKGVFAYPPETSTPFRGDMQKPPTSLQWLFLSNNRLSSLPAEVCQLSSLQRLSLRNNQLSSLPVEVCRLTSLQMLSLNNNPLQSPPPDVIAQGIRAIRAYLQAHPQPINAASPAEQ